MILPALTIDSEPIKYGLLRPGPEGSIFRTHFNSGFRKALYTKNKLVLPRFDFWKTKSRFKIIIADFDVLPSEFDCWEGLRGYLRHICPNGLVLESPSGKAKVLFKLELPEGVEISQAIAHDTLRHQIGELHEYCDRAATAARILFVNAKMFEWVSLVDTLKPIPAILDSIEEETSHEWHWIPEELPIPAYQALRDTFSDAQFFVMRFIASWSKRALETKLQLPQTYIAEQSRLLFESGLYHRAYTQGQISEAIYQLKRMQLLECVDHSYHVGRYAKLYEVKSVLRSALLSVLLFFSVQSLPPSSEDLRKEGSLVLSKSLPEWIEKRFIPDGSWNNLLWKATNFFRNKTDFLTWVKSVPGNWLKGRFRQAENAWNCHITSDSKYATA
jgi:hypothetical protein